MPRTTGSATIASSVRAPRAGLPAVTEETHDESMKAPLAVVIIAEAGIVNSARYLAEVGALAARGSSAG
jgi:hypothetical protein